MFFKYDNTKNLKAIASTNRKSVRRAIARFCYLKDVNLTPLQFETVVRRTQESGYESGVKFFADYFSGKTKWERKQLLFQFSIEYNMENHARSFPRSNKVISNILNGYKDPEDNKYFKDVLFSIVKANTLQEEIINKYIG
jgi:hypothetical protein